jgi:hypothetical protein
LFVQTWDKSSWNECALLEALVIQKIKKARSIVLMTNNYASIFDAIRQRMCSQLIISNIPLRCALRISIEQSNSAPRSTEAGKDAPSSGADPNGLRQGHVGFIAKNSKAKIFALA